MSTEKKLNKFKADMFTKLIKGTKMDICLGNSNNNNVTIELQSIRSTNETYDGSLFKFNVKVIRGTQKSLKRDENRELVVDENGNYVSVETEMKFVSRGRVNIFNRTIRSRVERELEKYCPVFSIGSWRIKCDKVQWF